MKKEVFPCSFESNEIDVLWHLDVFCGLREAVLCIAMGLKEGVAGAVWLSKMYINSVLCTKQSSIFLILFFTAIVHFAEISILGRPKCLTI